MGFIKRFGQDDYWAKSDVVVAGEFYFVDVCTANEGWPVQKQIEGSFSLLEKRLKLVGLSFSDVVRLECSFKNISDVTYLGDEIKKRFAGNYPNCKSIQTPFENAGTLFQCEAIAYKKQNELENE